MNKKQKILLGKLKTRVTQLQKKVEVAREKLRATLLAIKASEKQSSKKSHGRK